MIDKSRGYVILKVEGGAGAKDVDHWNWQRTLDRMAANYHSDATIQIIRVVYEDGTSVKMDITVRGGA